MLVFYALFFITREGVGVLPSKLDACCVFLSVKVGTEAWKPRGISARFSVQRLLEVWGVITHRRMSFASDRGTFFQALSCTVVVGRKRLPTSDGGLTVPTGPAAPRSPRAPLVAAGAWTARSWFETRGGNRQFNVRVGQRVTVPPGLGFGWFCSRPDVPPGARRGRARSGRREPACRAARLGPCADATTGTDPAPRR